MEWETYTYRYIGDYLGFNFQDDFELLALCCRSAFLLEYCKQLEKMQKQCKCQDLAQSNMMIYVWNGRLTYIIP